MSFSVDETLLVKCLRQAYPEACQLQVQKYQCEPCAITPGTNYTSDIFEVSVQFQCDGRPRTEFMIFKVPYVHKLYKQMRRLGVYEKESHMYTAIVPQLLAIAPVPALPRHYLLTESHVLVLENLTKSGYQLVDQRPWNADECVVLLEALAQFHATSVKLHQLQPTLLEPASVVTLYRDDVVVQTIDAVYPYLMAVLKAEDVPEGVLQKLVDYKQRFDLVSIYELADRVHDFRVLVHGNLKPNNALLRYDADKPVAAKILDYQTYLWKSPIFELLYFFVLTVDCDALENDGDRMVDAYLAALNNRLSSLGCGCTYSRNEYDRDLEASKLYQVFTLLFSSLLVLRECIPGFGFYGDPSHVPSQQDVENLRKNKRFDSGVLKWFRYFAKRGYFDWKSSN